MLTDAFVYRFIALAFYLEDPCSLRTAMPLGSEDRAPLSWEEPPPRRPLPGAQGRVHHQAAADYGFYSVSIFSVEME